MSTIRAKLIAVSSSITLAVVIAMPVTAAERSFTLNARVADWQLGAGQTVKAWTYNGTVPGPELRVTAGDTVRVTLTNSLPEATTVHWHGVPVPNGMDGVPGVSAPVIPAGGQFTYSFTAPAPGTYWYHPHANSNAQISRGLYGLLIVDPPAGTAKAWDREVSLVIGEFGGMMGGVVTRPGSGMGMGGGMGGGMGSGGGMTSMMGGTLLINGKTGPYVPEIRIARGERVLFRMVNTGDMVHPMHVHGLHWTIIATDGFALTAPYAKDTLPINAGERYDGILVGDNPGRWMLHCHNLVHTGDGGTGLSFDLVVRP
jgi:FtsP/CotA-like multicopper oxidase with cupredoxin domain